MKNEKELLTHLHEGQSVHISKKQSFRDLKRAIVVDAQKTTTEDLVVKLNHAFDEKRPIIIENIDAIGIRA